MLSQLQDLPGLAILDSGCNRTMHGDQWCTAFEEKLAEFDLKPTLRKKKQLFKGIGGHSESKVVKGFAIGIGGVNGTLHSAETNGKIPMLISRPFMQSLGTVIINIGAGTVTFEKIGVHDLPLIRTCRGHLAILPSCHLAILPSCHLAILPSCHLAISLSLSLSWILIESRLASLASFAPLVSLRMTRTRTIDSPPKMPKSPELDGDPFAKMSPEELSEFR